jgi:hypothetical protein
LFAASILPISTAYAVCEGLGFESGLDKKFHEAPVFYWLYTLLIVFGAGVLLVPRLPLVTGTDSVLLSPFDFLADPTTYLRVISSERGTISTMPNFGFELAKGFFDCALSMTIIRSAEPRKGELFQLVHLCRFFLQGVLQCPLEDQNLHLVLRVRAMR